MEKTEMSKVSKEITNIMNHQKKVICNIKKKKTRLKTNEDFKKIYK